ncbi:MAG: hypothetical protein QM775_21250 [Pirellulales bacterium]
MHFLLMQPSISYIIAQAAERLAAELDETDYRQDFVATNGQLAVDAALDRCLATLCTAPAFGDATTNPERGRIWKIARPDLGAGESYSGELG